ncbi:hypothetical protein ACHAXA_002795, partial [Cyclostephanos tholiformis]
DSTMPRRSNRVAAVRGISAVAQPPPPGLKRPSTTTKSASADANERKKRAKRESSSSYSTSSLISPESIADGSSGQGGKSSSPYFDRGANGERSVDKKEGVKPMDEETKGRKAMTSEPKEESYSPYFARDLNDKDDKVENGDDGDDDNGRDSTNGGGGGNEPDGHGGLNQPSHPWTVEYSKTGRATCRTCDERISKGDLRVGHAPLFRGKPGFVVYRHLDCAVFPEDVACTKDIVGHADLNDDDRSRLANRIEMSKALILEENTELHPDELVQDSFRMADGCMRAEPGGLNATLLPFQLEGYNWMIHQETSASEEEKGGIRGGILADEMGMGKTIQTIAMILGHRPKLQHTKPGMKHNAIANDLDERRQEEALWDGSMTDWNDEMDLLKLPKKFRSLSRGENSRRAGTLVICPVIALSQWRTEIEKFTDEGALSVCTYHGPDREVRTPREMMKNYDIVLTTYQVLEADFRKMTSPNRVECPNCGGKFKIDKLPIHLKYFCGDAAERTEAQARQRRNSDRDEGGNGRRSRSGGHSNGDGHKRGGKQKEIKNTKYSTEMKIKKQVEKNATANNGTKTKPLKKPVKNISKKSLKKPAKKAKIDSDDMTPRAALEMSKAAKKPMAKAKNQTSTSRELSKKKTATTGKRNVKLKKFDDDSDDSSFSSNYSELGDVEDEIDMAALMEKAMAGAKNSVLHSLCWWRIVLDEAHFIKSRSSQTANAAFSLIGIHRWCLSGTPLQNRVGEFYSLVRFLRLDPMAFYYCRAKDCDCKSMHYRIHAGICEGCGHSGIQHYSHFNKYILNPIQREGYSGDGRRAMFLLKNEVLDKTLLRRTKENRASDMELPPRLVQIKEVSLHPVEEDFYSALYTQTKSSFDDYVNAGTLLNNYAHIFDLLIRMRQSVDHPYLVVYSKKNSSDQAALAQVGDIQSIANGSVDCDLCHEPPTERVVSTCCGAAYCKACVIEFMATSNSIAASSSLSCPSCRGAFSIDLQECADIEDDSSLNVSLAQKTTIDTDCIGPSLKELQHVATGSILRRINLAEFATSSKIEALTRELVLMRQTSPGSKAIVFSQFVNMLDLIRWRLHSDPYLEDLGLGCRALHGGMNIKARDDCLKEFRENNNVRVLLMSLKAGGVALNLTCANYIYLMDPWWNPAAEMQAIDRTHRLGQFRPIRAVRFIAENTVEERILQLQEKKRLVFDGTVGRDAASLKMLTVDDMKSLFA